MHEWRRAIQNKLFWVKSTGQEIDIAIFQIAANVSSLYCPSETPGEARLSHGCRSSLQV